MKLFFLLFFAFILCLDLHAEPTWSISGDYDNQIFPSYIISMATIPEQLKEGALKSAHNRIIGEPFGLVGIDYKSDRNESVTLTVSSPNLIASTEFKFDVVAGTSYKVFPPLNWDYERLNKVNEPFPETVSFKVSDSSGESDQSATMTVRARTDCLMGRYNNKGEPQFISWTPAAYVNENSPIIERILEDGLRTGIVSNFQGGGEARSVTHELFCIWYVLSRYGMKYTSISTSSAGSQKVISQCIRPFEDSIRNKQANCIDGSVLFASIARKIGMHPFLVLRPGHCYFVVQTPDSPVKWVALETTMIGQYVPTRNSSRDAQVIYSIFQNAVRVGYQNFMEDLPYLQHQNTSNRYALVDIDNCRNVLGILPLRSKLAGNN